VYSYDLFLRRASDYNRSSGPLGMSNPVEHRFFVYAEAVAETPNYGLSVICRPVDELLIYVCMYVHG
jgi:hypothetical protein